MYKSKRKVKELIEGYESEKDLHIDKIKECDYQISRARTTTERVAWERVREKSVKSYNFCEDCIKDLENNPNTLLYIVVLGVILVTFGVLNHFF